MMNDISDLSLLARLMRDRAGSAVLAALIPGRALTATEVSRAAAASQATVDSYLAKLLAARVVSVERQGRHRYFRLADQDVATAIEQLAGPAEPIDIVQVRTGPTDPALRKARVCYDHLAGDVGVFVYDSFKARRLVRGNGDQLALTDAGDRFVADLGIDLDPLRRGRRPLGRQCLDWSVRRHHLAGALGGALLERCFDLGWARRETSSRVVRFSASGEREFRRRLAR